MKLQSIETHVVANPPPSRGGRYFIFVQLETACGIAGVGEIYNATFSPHLVADMAKDVFARIFDCQDPHHIERLWRNTYGAGYTLRPDVTVMGVLSALEMACWDIIGKAAGKPVYELLGGKVHEKLRSYTYLYPPGDENVYPDPDTPNVYNDPDIAAEIALHWVDQGFTAVKFDPAGPYTVYDCHQPSMEDLERSELFCKRIREAVGTRADLLFGTHGQFTVSGAKRMARRIEPYDPLWFEEPVPPEMPEQMAEVARATSIPISTGERLCTKYEFARVLDTGAASILQMDLGRVGGLLEAKKIAAMAETRYAQIAPHLYCGPIVGAANIQLAACTPNFLILESIQKWDGFHADLLTKPILWENGYVVPPQEPGLGIELNEAVARANPYTGDALHLTMETEPLR
ncbi:MAG: mandelate racemase/muconate lactonizing enzyme family protein [Hyphomicrobiales bacterium]|nr:mandelate racemase/muconate lactonizing enzyme family protein [Hyphomicrobiales bacterium]MCP5000094.1 mandelate racemase/muconate lactonizing enzyme family protein [Hyphomicrobiales bacterium]